LVVPHRSAIFFPIKISSERIDALCRLDGISEAGQRKMASSAYLLQQAETLIAMSRATLDLGIAGRLREMVSEFQARAVAQEDPRRFTAPQEEGSSS
jgi:hypothetical protein